MFLNKWGKGNRFLINYWEGEDVINYLKNFLMNEEGERIDFNLFIGEKD